MTEPFLERGKRLAAWCCVVAIGVISLLPAAEVAALRTSMGGHSEHLLAYATATLITVFAYIDQSRLKIVFALILYAAALEYLQRFSPGRFASVEDLGFSVTGVMLGAGIFHVIQYVRTRQPSSRPSQCANEDLPSSS
jgi:VanZ like family